MQYVLSYQLHTLTYGYHQFYRGLEAQGIVFIYPVTKWGTEFITSTVGHQFKCKPRTGLTSFSVGLHGFYATGSVRLAPSAHWRKSFEDEEEIFYALFCKSSNKSVNWVS